MQNSELDDVKTIDNLDNGILRKIFKHIKCQELLENLFFVCKKWQKVIIEMDKSLKFDSNNQQNIFEIIYKFPDTINEIILDGLYFDLASIFTRLRIRQRNLKHVHINNCKISEDSFTSALRLRKFLESHNCLESLSLTNCMFLPAKILDIIPQLIHLRSLTIGNIPDLTSPSLTSILLNTVSLTCIHLYRIEWFTDQDMKFLLSNDRLNSRLREFSLDQVSELTSAAYQYILKCTNLEKLHINYSIGFSPETLMKIRDKLPRLRSFVIERVCRIKSRNLSSFFQDNPLKLNEFELTDCCTHLEDSALDSLVQSQHKNLLHLRLSNCCKLTKASEILEKCKFLKTLDLSGCEQIDQDISIVSSCLSKIVLPFHLKEKNFIARNESVTLQFASNYDNVIEIYT